MNFINYQEICFHFSMIIIIYFDENNYNKVTNFGYSLTFHKRFGYQKKNINNECKITPRKHYVNDFQDIFFEKIDNGPAFEIILIGKIGNLSYLMNSKNTEKIIRSKIT